jgi:protein TonB
MTTMAFYHSAVLPWTVSPQEEGRFRRILLLVLGAVLLASAIIPLVPVPAPSELAAVEVPPRFAKLIMQERPKPPPPPPPVVEKAEPKPEPEKPAEKPPEPEAPKPAPREEKVAAPTPPPQPSAREKAARSGLLALRDELADLRTNTVVETLEKQPLRKAAAESASVDATRSIITSQVATGSGGINTSRLSRDTGGTQLAGRETTRVTAPVEEEVQARSTSGTGKSGPLPSRSSEEIQMVFDRNKGTLNAIYNRALRQNPALAGKVVLKLTIAPSGSVTQCELVSSELGDPELERKLVARVQLFEFGQKSAVATTITYPIDFFPG